MPKYLYRCKNCEAEFFAYHPMSEKLKDCEQCESVDTLKKIPSNFFLKKEHNQEKKIGDEVKTAIKDFRSDLEKDKVEIKNREWKSDE